jgi:hypothetical protein
LALYRRFAQIFLLMDGSGCPLDHLVNPKDLLNKILFGAFREFHLLLLSSANVLSHAKLSSYVTNTTILVYFLPNRKYA